VEGPIRGIPWAAAAACWLAGASALGAQEVSVPLEVRVTHRGVPVAEAEVRVGDRAALTDESGRAVLRLPPGAYRVAVRRIGFEPRSARVTLRPGAPARVALELEAAAVEVEGLIVTATRSERPVEEEPIRVEALPQEEIDENVALAPGNLTTVLTDLGGVRIQTTSPALGGAQVRLLGLRGRYTQVLVDGLPLVTGGAAAFGVAQIPPIDLAQVEVIKGAASALYGGSALGGVVNLVSRRPIGAAELLASRTSRRGTDVVAFIPHGFGPRGGLTFLASGHDQDEVDVDGDGWTDLAGYRRAVVRPRLFLDPGPGRSLILTAGGLWEERAGGTVRGALVADGRPYRESRRTRRADAGAVGRVLLAGEDPASGLRLSARAAVVAEGHEHRHGDAAYEDTHATGFVEATLQGSLGPHRWLAGLAYQEERYRASALAPLEYTYRVPALFLQDVAALGTRWTFSASARADLHDRYGTFVSPRVSVLFRPAGVGDTDTEVGASVSGRPGPDANGWSVRGSAALGYAAPTPFIDRTEEIGLARVAPLRGLVPERARSVSLDVERAAGAWLFSLALFGTEIDRALLLRPSETAPDSLVLANAASPQRAYGLEARARYRRGPLYVLVSHTVLRSREESPAGGRRDTPLTPRHLFMMDAVVEPDEETRIGIEAAYIGRQPLEEDDPYRAWSRPYANLGFLAERRAGPARLFLNAENLLDARQTRWAPLLRPERAADGRWTTDVWAPLEGRVLNAGLRVAF
jgi:outer membrane receptor for ferrienterochelin and colicins